MPYYGADLEIGLGKSNLGMILDHEVEESDQQAAAVLSDFH